MTPAAESTGNCTLARVFGGTVTSSVNLPSFFSQRTATGPRTVFMLALAQVMSPTGSGRTMMRPEPGPDGSGAMPARCR